MRTLSNLLIVSCLGVLSACTLFVEVKDPPANNGNNVNNNNATCGDGTRNGTEECDLQDLGGATCESMGFDPSMGGVLACNANCTFDTSGCGGGTCGDGQVDIGEDCESANLNGYTCLNFDFKGGYLTCDDDCHFNTSQCSETSVCGDGLRATDEPCDGDDFGGTTCESLNMGFTGGTLQCTNCEIDTGSCTSGETENCNNFMDDDGDGFTDCDDPDCMNSPDCMVFQEICTDGIDNDGDVLTDCDDPDCSTHTNCQVGSCGDGQVNGSEQCDGANLNGQTCIDHGYTEGGVLMCDGTCNFDLTGCIGYNPCGNGVIDPGPGEDCDGAFLQGYECQDFGFLAGTTLGCNATSCLFDFSACGYNSIMSERNLVASGSAHTCAASSTGVRCWGYNYFEQLGNTTPYIYRPTPGQAVKYSTFNLGATAIAAGGLHSCIVATNSSIVGKVVCWGANGSGQLGNGSSGSNSPPVVAGSLTNVTAIAAGQEHTCALRNDGTVWCWGSNIYGQVGDGSAGSLVVTPTQVSGLTNFVTDLSAGAQHTCAVRTQTAGQGQLYCWGRNESGQLGNNSTNPEPVPIQISLTDVRRVACGSEHTCAIAGGDVYCWGSNSHGQLGVSGNYIVPNPVAAYTAFKIMAGGNNTCIVQNTTGPVYCWGDNSHGQLGQGNNVPYTGPIVLGLNDFTGLSVGGGHTCGIWLDGGSNKVMCWGGNWYGQVGNGDNLDQYSPTQVLGQN